MQTTLVTRTQQLLQRLEQRRSPWTAAEERLLDGYQASVRFPEPTSCLHQALKNRDNIILRHPDTLDGKAATYLLSTYLHRYWGVQVQNEVVGSTKETNTTACYLLLGKVEAPGEAKVIARLQPLTQENWPGCLTRAAWKLAGDLLVSFDEQKARAYTFYDLETTGTNVRRDEIVEIAAWRYENGRPAAPFFHHFVQPTAHKFIPAAASRVHHIYWQDVADKPPIAKVLPQFLTYAGGTTLVGHNITNFDNRILNRELAAYFNSRLTMPCLDTLPLARQLLPGEKRYRQQDLLRRLSLAEKQTHRADDDVRQVADLFYTLLDINLRQQARHAATDLLPLLGVVLLAEGVPLKDENMALLDGAARVWRRAAGDAPAVNHFLANLPEAEQQLVLEKLSALGDRPLPPDEASTTWKALQEEFIRQVTAFVNQSDSSTLLDFLDYQALRTHLDEVNPDADRVTMMTLHNAKGSEYPVVIITTLEENHMPLWRQREDDAGIAEERRLFYVGMTRAQERLYLISVRNRGDDFVRPPSPFSFEIPATAVKRYQMDKRGRLRQLSPTEIAPPEG